MIESDNHACLPYDEWFEAHRRHLEKEKRFSRRRAELAAERRELPWLAIDKEYRFETEIGELSLADLFRGRSQLIIVHFMFAPGSDHRCTGCSFLADHIDASAMHLVHHDISLAVCSRAPLSEIMPFKERMGWNFDWVSSGDGDFNYDFRVSFTPEQIASGKAVFNYHERPVSNADRGGCSIFFRNGEGKVFHTFASRGRGGENLIGTYGYLDMMPKGRNEIGPYRTLADWVRLHDEYSDTSNSECDCTTKMP